jgi:hypothetical protein
MADTLSTLLERRICKKVALYLRNWLCWTLFLQFLWYFLVGAHLFQWKVPLTVLLACLHQQQTTLLTTIPSTGTIAVPTQVVEGDLFALKAVFDRQNGQTLVRDINSNKAVGSITTVAKVGDVSTNDGQTIGFGVLSS